MGMEPEEKRVCYVKWVTTAQATLEKRLSEIAVELCEPTKSMMRDELMMHCVEKINGRAS